jgi:hypothetical protein
MTLEEWADRVDELIGAEDPNPPAHETGAAQDPTWRYDGRIVAVRVAEDASSLRAVFVPRDDADEAFPSQERSRTRIYLRGEPSARDAARDIISFLTFAL